MRAIAYCRVSCPNQAGLSRYSLAYQETLGRSYADERAWQLLHVVRDVASGGDPHRPGYRRMLSAIEERAVDVIVAHRLDRLSRRTHDIYELLEMSDRAGVGIVAIRESLDTTTAAGRAMVGITAVFAQFARETISEYLRNAKRRRAQAGDFPGGPAAPPFGYDYDYDQAKLVVNPREAEVVRLIFRLRTQDRWPMRRIVRHLNDTDVRSKNGGAWHLPTMRRLLRRPTYTGRISLHGELYNGKHEPIIDDEAFRLAQDLSRGPRPAHPPPDCSKRPLRGIASCGYCGATMWLTHMAAKPRRHARTGRRRVVYRHQVRPSLRGARCPGVTKDAHGMEDAVIAKIQEMARHPSLAGLIAGTRPARTEALVAAEQDRLRVTESLEALDDAHSRLAAHLDAQMISAAEFRTTRSALLDAQAQLRSEGSSLDARIRALRLDGGDVQTAVTVLRRFVDDWDTLADHDRHRLLKRAVLSLRVWRTKAELRLVGCPPVEVPLLLGSRKTSQR